jgi:hypothetical protein
MPCLSLVSCSAYSLILKTKATLFSETFVDFLRTARRCIPEDRTPDNILFEFVVFVVCQGEKINFSAPD